MNQRPEDYKDPTGQRIPRREDGEPLVPLEQRLLDDVERDARRLELSLKLLREYRLSQREPEPKPGGSVYERADRPICFDA